MCDIYSSLLNFRTANKEHKQNINVKKSLLIYTILNFERKFLHVYMMLETSVSRSTLKHSSGKESSAVKKISLV